MPQVLVIKIPMRIQLRSFISIGLILLLANCLLMLMFGMRERLIIDMNRGLYKRKIKGKEIRLNRNILGRLKNWLSLFKEKIKDMWRLWKKRDK